MHCPIGPAPRTTARSPGLTAARFTARTAMDTGSAIAAIAGSPTAIGNTCACPMASRSWRPPSRWIPVSVRRSHAFGRPAAHG